MKQRRIKVFLSSYGNMTQAQCLNCRALAQYLDKTRFEVAIRTVYSGDLPIEPLAGVRRFHVRYPARIWEPIQFIRGLLWCDVAFLPSPEHWRWSRGLLRILGKKCFRTVEGVIDGIAYERAVACFGSEENVRHFFTQTDKVYAITKAMIEKNRQAIGLSDPNGVLYLGTDYAEFAVKKQVTALTDVILIGADLKRKGIDDYLVLAAKFPGLRFHVAGGSVGGIDYAKQCADCGLANIIFHGPVSHAQLAELLKRVQLHIFPSRAEGFPKVTLETAAAGVPSVVYGDYGATEWITSGQDGFVVSTVDEMAGIIRDLLAHPEKLQPLADGARAMAQRFDWRVVVKDWEREIEGLVK